MAGYDARRSVLAAIALRRASAPCAAACASAFRMRRACVLRRRRASAAACEAALQIASDLGATLVEVDLAPVLRGGALLYEGAWVAERYAAIRAFIEDTPGRAASR